MSSYLENIMALIITIGLAGAILGGLIGALIGLAIAIGLGIAYYPKRHKHVWQCGIVYDKKGNPQFMLKFCDCGEMEFDGYIKRKNQNDRSTLAMFKI